MFDRLSSLIIALTLITIAAVLAALAGGQPLAVALLSLAGFAAAAIVYAAVPGAVTDAHAATSTLPSSAPSLLRHPGFARWAGHETDPFIGTRDNVVTFANDAAVELLGPHITGADIRTAIRHPAVVEWLADGGMSGTAREVSLVDFPRPGQRWTMRTAALPEDERIIILSDRSAIDAAERMRSDFVANASHELRTPLAAILGYVETLQDPSGDADPALRRRFLAIIEREARRMQQLVLDLLSISRIEADRFRRPTTPVDLAAVVGDTVAQLRESDDARAQDIVLTRPGDPLPILGDTAQLAQLAHNIITNAMKYGRAGTPIIVKLERAAGRVRLSISDEGDGIAPAHLPRLTERFYRADEARSRAVGGTGLGLAIVKHISERHQGQLDIASEVGRGSCVSVSFPPAQ